MAANDSGQRKMKWRKHGIENRKNRKAWQRKQRGIGEIIENQYENENNESIEA